MPRLMRVLMEWAFRAVGFAMIGVALAGAMREAMAEVLAGAACDVLKEALTGALSEATRAAMTAALSAAKMAKLVDASVAVCVLLAVENRASQRQVEETLSSHEENQTASPPAFCFDSGAFASIIAVHARHETE